MREWAVQRKTFLDGDYDHLIDRAYLKNQPLTQVEAVELARMMNEGKPVQIARAVYREVPDWTVFEEDLGDNDWGPGDLEELRQSQRIPGPPNPPNPPENRPYG